MENMTDEAGGNAKPGRKIDAAAFPRILRTGVFYSLALSLAFFVLYMAGSSYAPGVPDALLFVLLRLMRVCSFLLSAASLVAVGFAVRRVTHRPGTSAALAVLAYFLLVLFGAVMVMFSLLIVSFSAGSG